MKDYSRGHGGRAGSPGTKQKFIRLNWFHVILIGLAVVTACVLFILGRYAWREKRWRWIVVHHTASDVGNLEYYRRLHREERGWRDIAYHFLINNGSSNTAVGQIEESALWKNRESHFSTRETYVNVFSIAVVLVGNFEKHRVPDLQKEALIKLLADLSYEYSIPPDRIVGHREISSTACPGKNLNMADLRTEVAKFLAEHPRSE